MPLLTRPGASIYYELIGDPALPCITLINGHTRSSSDFRMMARVLSENGLCVVLLDNRGSGKTEVSRAFTINDMWEDVVGVWNELSIRTSHVLGISLGGFIAEGLAIHAPERVNRLILVSTTSEETFIKPNGGSWSSEGTNLEEKMRAYFAPGFVERNPVLFTTMVNQIRQAVKSGHFTERVNYQRTAMAGASLTSELGKIRSETLIIHGDQDLVIDVAGAQLLKANIQKSTLHVMNHVGHLLLAEAPKELYKLVLDFL
jgi:3-oxoadipate enol-lactonase